MAENVVKVLFINNGGGGFADYKEIPADTTVSEFFAKEMGSYDPESYLIRVNRETVSKDYVLKESDRVSITPSKVEGA